jgi:hypothetical protein
MEGERDGGREEERRGGDQREMYVGIEGKVGVGATWTWWFWGAFIQLKEVDPEVELALFQLFVSVSISEHGLVVAAAACSGCMSILEDWIHGNHVGEVSCGVSCLLPSWRVVLTLPLAGTRHLCS